MDPHLNVIVGPNGVGKTNLFHAMRAVCDALSIERRQATTLWANAGHRGTNADTITIEVELELTTSWEQRLLGVFFAAALCDQQEIQHRVSETAHHILDPTGLRQFAAWVHEHLRLDDLAWLFRGRLIATYGGRWSWQCRYESSRGSPRFRLDLTGGGSLIGTAENNSNTAGANWGSLFVVWRNRLTEHERQQLDQGLTGVTQASEFPLLDFSEMPAWVSSQNGVTFQIGDSQQIVDPMTLMTSRAFFKAAQISPEPRRVYGMRFVFEQLLARALVFTDNVRLPPLTLSMPVPCLPRHLT